LGGNFLKSVIINLFLSPCQQTRRDRIENNENRGRLIEAPSCPEYFFEKGDRNVLFFLYSDGEILYR
jgi:hypothetical protein